MEGLDIPVEWEGALRKILGDGLRKIIILGDEDTGKSTLALYLLNRIKFEVSFIDADIGQKDLGPPATITLGRTGQPISSPDEMEVEGMYFVGSVSPTGHLLPQVVGTRLLADQAVTPFVIVNTTGFIRDAGFALKTFKIEILRPDAILALQRDRELEGLLKAFSYIRSFRLPVSKKAVAKSARERRRRRFKAFMSYFKDSRILEMEMENLILQRGTHLRENLLCGLADKGNNLLGLGVVADCKDKISILTPVEGEVSIIQLGSMQLEIREGVVVSEQP